MKKSVLNLITVLLVIAMFSFIIIFVLVTFAVMDKIELEKVVENTTCKNINYFKSTCSDLDMQYTYCMELDLKLKQDLQCEGTSN